MKNRSLLNPILIALLAGVTTLASVGRADSDSNKESGKESTSYSESKENESEDSDKEDSDKESKGESKSASKSSSKESSVQSSTRPQGLNIVDKVQEAGSDEGSKRFQTDVLPDLTKLVNIKLGERVKIDDSGMLLDPSKLKLKTDSDVRVYFVGEGAGYANTLGFTTDGSGRASSSTAKLIFPNASSAESTYDPKSSVKRTENEPLLPGDFVNLGAQKGGSQLDFFLVADGANKGKNTYSTQKSVNPDGINHVISFAYAMKDSPYLILGFEDLLGGGDRDFNDLIFAVDIGAINVGALTATPEPATYATMAAFLGLGAVLVRRRNK